MKKSRGSLLATVVLVILGLVAFLNRQLIRDNYIVRTTSLTSASQTIGSDLSLTSSAGFIYRASQPEVRAATQFNQSCKSVAREQSIVLGCYTNQRIYIYDVADQRLNGVKQVTTAHELLHAAYLRMPSSEKTEVNKLLETTADSISDPRFKATLAEYRKTEPDQIDNELHSIIGTEIAVIPAALEKHYQKYFTNRQKIVSYSKQYEETFTSVQDQIKDYDQQLSDLKNRKDSLEKSLPNEQSSIEAENQRLNALKSSGGIASYNAAVPAYNASISQYNTDVATLKQVIATYNSLVEKRNQLATTQNDLAHQLNSNYQTLE
jgi:hypothetical protein